MAVAIRFTTDFVVGIFVVALAATSRSSILALSVGSTSVHVREAAAGFFTTSLCPLALSIVVTFNLIRMTIEALGETR